MPESTRSIPPETVQARCPQCGTTFVASVRTIVDASDEDARQALLSGQVNRASCPTCGAIAQVTVPVLYYDHQAEFAGVLVPMTLNLPHDEQERAIGRLANRVLASLPSEQRKMYLLQPQTYLSEDSFVRAIFAASGVTDDALLAVRAAADLVEVLLAAPDEAARKEALADAERAVDYDFLLLITALADDANQRGDAVRARALSELRDDLARTNGVTITLDGVLTQLQAAQEAGQLDEAVAHFRSILDYAFFSALTQRIEAAGDGPDAQALTRLRTDLLAAIDRVDATAKAEIEAAVATLRSVLQAPDPVAAVRALPEAPSPAFFLVLDANLAAASDDDRQQLTALLARVRDAAIELIEEQMPPLERLVNRLARTNDPAAQAALLDGSPELLGSDLATMIAEMVAAARSANAADVAAALESAARALASRLEALEAVEARP